MKTVLNTRSTRFLETTFDLYDRYRDDHRERDRVLPSFRHPQRHHDPRPWSWSWTSYRSCSQHYYPVDRHHDKPTTSDRLSRSWKPFCLEDLLQWSTATSGSRTFWPSGKWLRPGLCRRGFMTLFMTLSTVNRCQPSTTLCWPGSSTPERRPCLVVKSARWYPDLTGFDLGTLGPRDADDKDINLTHFLPWNGGISSDFFHRESFGETQER